MPDMSEDTHCQPQVGERSLWAPSDGSEIKNGPATQSWAAPLDYQRGDGLAAQRHVVVMLSWFYWPFSLLGANTAQPGN